MLATKDLTTIWLQFLLTLLLTIMPLSSTTTTTNAPITTTTTTMPTTAGQTKAITLGAAMDIPRQDHTQQQQHQQQLRAIRHHYQQQLDEVELQLQPQDSQFRQGIAALVDTPALDLTSAGTNSLRASPQSSGTAQRGNIRENIHHSNHINSINNMDYNALDETKTVTDEMLLPPPVFDFGVPRNITVRKGQAARFLCRVDNMGDKSVAWIRKRDLHILTVALHTYTSDQRFQALHTVNTRDWTLQLKYAQPRDGGIYECQVNTEPKISMAYRLNVIVSAPDAKAIIAGPTDLYVKVGSAITLTCHVNRPSAAAAAMAPTTTTTTTTATSAKVTSTALGDGAAQDIGPIHWYRGPYILTPFAAHPNEAAIDLQRISMESKLGEKLQSRLRIANAQASDSGNYSCMPTTADAASVMVNVINDENPAAMQKSSAASMAAAANRNGVYIISLLVLVFLLRLRYHNSIDVYFTAVRWWPRWRI